MECSPKAQSPYPVPRVITLLLSRLLGGRCYNQRAVEADVDRHRASLRAVGHQRRLQAPGSRRAAEGRLVLSDQKDRVQTQFGEVAASYVTSRLHAEGEDLVQLVEWAEGGPDRVALDIATGCRCSW